MIILGMLALFAQMLQSTSVPYNSQGYQTINRVDQSGQLQPINVQQSYYPTSASQATTIEEGPRYQGQQPYQQQQSQMYKQQNSQPVVRPPKNYQDAPQDYTPYSHPGIIIPQGSAVQGSDHLYNLSYYVQIAVEIVKPEGYSIGVTSEELQELIAEQFRIAKIEPYAQVAEGKPFLPVFHLLVMVSTINQGYVVFMEGRLFESVTLDRVVPEKGSFFQAITWETQDLIVTPANDVARQVKKATTQIAKQFGDRFAYFDLAREKQIRRKLMGR